MNNADGFFSNLDDIPTALPGSGLTNSSLIGLYGETQSVRLFPEHSLKLEARHGAIKVRDLTELLGVDDKHIYRMAVRGQLPSFRVGSAVRFDPQELAKWLRSKYPVVPSGPNVLLVERLPARFPVIERALLSQDGLGWTAPEDWCGMHTTALAALNL